MTSDEYTILEDTPDDDRGDQGYVIIDDADGFMSDAELNVGLDDRGIFVEFVSSGPVSGDTGVSLSATARLRPEGARDMADALREMADLAEGRE